MNKSPRTSMLKMISKLYIYLFIVLLLEHQWNLPNVLKFYHWLRNFTIRFLACFYNFYNSKRPSKETSDLLTKPLLVFSMCLAFGQLKCYVLIALSVLIKNEKCVCDKFY